jgi:hypothetical protein
MSSERTAPTARSTAGTVQLELLSNLRARTTGVNGAILWVAAGEFREADAHLGPRLLVALGEDLSATHLDTAAIVTLEAVPQVHGELPLGVRRAVYSFIVRNKEILLSYWHGESDTMELCSELVP